MLNFILDVFCVLYQQYFTQTLLIILLPLLYFYTKRNHGYWQNRGVPGPKPLPIFGNSLDGKSLAGKDLEMINFNKYGKLYGTFEGQKPVLNVADPDIVKLITVKDWHVFINRSPTIAVDPAFTKNLTALRDDKWKNVRSLISPTFTSGKIRRMMDLMRECVDGVLVNLETASAKNEEVDAKKLFGAYSMDVIARTAFAVKTDSHTNPDNPFLVNARAMFKLNPLRLLAISFIPKSIRRAFDIDFVGGTCRAFFKDVSYHLLRQRREGNQQHNDFLQLLIEAENNESADFASAIKDINEGHFLNENKEDLDRNARAMSKGTAGTKITDEEAMAQMVVFFLAGYETTNTLLSYCAYCLATNPDKQDQLYDELRNACQKGEDGGDLTYEELNRLDYLNAVISETLRLYPPAIKMGRETNEDYTIGETGIRISKGTGISLAFYALHHDKDNFPEPEVFKPERFVKENIREIKPYTYLPFGAGPRNCIGMRFALVEAKLAIAKVVLNYKIVPTDKTELKFAFHPSNLVSKEVIVKFEKRSLKQ